MPAKDEKEFRAWYGKWASQLGLDPDPDNPKHFYDYRAAFRAGAEPTKESGWHWPSEYKREGHPNLIVEGRDTRTGRKLSKAEFASRLLKGEFQEYLEPIKEVGRTVAENVAGLSGLIPSGDPGTLANRAVGMMEGLKENPLETVTGLPVKAIKEGNWPRAATQTAITLGTAKVLTPKLSKGPMPHPVPRIGKKPYKSKPPFIKQKSEPINFGDVEPVIKPKGSASAVVDEAGRPLLGKGGSVGPVTTGAKAKVPDMPVPQAEIEKFLGLRPGQIRKGDIDQILKLTRENEGATWHMRQGNLSGTPHYAVATMPEANVKVSGRDLTAKDIADFIQKTAKARRENPELSIGTWWNKKKGEYDLDLVSAIKDREDAIKRGYLHNQDAIYDLLKGEEIPMDWTGKQRPKK